MNTAEQPEPVRAVAPVSDWRGRRSQTGATLGCCVSYSDGRGAVSPVRQAQGPEPVEGLRTLGARDKIAPLQIWHCRSLFGSESTSAIASQLVPAPTDFPLRRLADRPDRHDLVGVYDQGKRALIREDHQIPGVWMHHQVVGMRQQIRVSARKRDLDRKFHRSPHQTFQRRAHASLVAPHFSRCNLFLSAHGPAGQDSTARAAKKWDC